METESTPSTQYRRERPSGAYAFKTTQKRVGGAVVALQNLERIWPRVYVNDICAHVYTHSHTNTHMYARTHKSTQYAHTYTYIPQPYFEWPRPARHLRAQHTRARV